MSDGQGTYMRHYISNFVRYANKHAYSILFILFVLWMCVGIFPLVCYETDSQEVILGCDLLYYNGWKFPPIYCYEYRMQPLTVIMVVAFKHILSFLSCEQIYCLLAAISSFIFLIGSVEFIQHITPPTALRYLLQQCFYRKCMLSQCILTPPYPLLLVLFGHLLVL